MILCKTLSDLKVKTYFFTKLSCFAVKLCSIVVIKFDKIKKSVILINHWENLLGLESKNVDMMNKIESSNT